jgi:hypothetical protein
MSLVGARVLRKEDPRLLTGTGQFVDDIAPTGCLFASFVTSTEAHARITAIDVRAALATEGVVAVYTAEDFAETACSWGDPITASYRGAELLEHPPNGQGATAALILNILSQFDMAALAPESPERVHLEAEATRLAYDARDRFIADPDLPGAAARLARMLGANASDGSSAMWKAVADYLVECQIQRVTRACQLQISRGIEVETPLLGAGVGRFLVERVAQRLGRPYQVCDPLTGLMKTGPGVALGADMGPAVAVASLMQEGIQTCAF